MKKWIILCTTLLFLSTVFFFAFYLEEIDSNVYRIVSYSSLEAKENLILINKYKQIDNGDSLFFIVKEAWTQKSVQYIKNKIYRINEGEFFVISIDPNKKYRFFDENVVLNWKAKVDGAIGGVFSGGNIYLFFDKKHFDDKIFVKIELLEKGFSKIKTHTIVDTIKFNRVSQNELVID